MAYAIYKGIKYYSGISDSKVWLRSKNKKDGFDPYIEFDGTISEDIFIKNVEISDLSAYYDLDYRVIYKGDKYECANVRKKLIEENKLTIFTTEYEVAEKYDFTRMEPFLYRKEVPLDEIEALIEIKKYMLGFNDNKEETTRIDGKDLRKYLAGLVD